MSHPPRRRDLARKLALLPLIVTALLVAVAPAAPASGPDSDKGSSAVNDHKPAGVGDGRKFK